jgi:simple sugar transport system ATP-binding protein
MATLLRLENIAKSFGPVQSLVNVSFALGDNEILGLVGDNGAGKSSLVKILSGVFPPDSGTISFAGQGLDNRNFSSATARRLGIETVHQDRSLAEKQPLWRNIFAGRHLTNALGFIRVEHEKAETIKILRNIIELTAAGLDADAPASVLSGGERQGLAIGRAMYFQSRLVILDEPTTALSLRETAKVLGFIDKIREAGKSCIFISHNIAQVYAAADRFLVMDRGRLAGDIGKEQTSLAALTELLLTVSQEEAAHV